ncbi:MAG: hypothetical protein J0M15_00215 [Deltaproteobacteria bacterium]|nr:hypothetical protein [Deltaproteobacteria bacterium]
MIKILLVITFCFYTLTHAEEPAAGSQGSAGGPPQPETTPTPTAEPINMSGVKKFDLKDQVDILKDIDKDYRRAMRLDEAGTEAGLNEKVKGICPNCVLADTKLSDNSNPRIEKDKGKGAPSSKSGGTDGGSTSSKEK